MARKGREATAGRAEEAELSRDGDDE